ncbi:MAG TPA: hypothetical protein VN736_15125 [Candidatus Limnocylindrales bacterium]|jgi:hypothetical protein|nr:hypothetical protein [Candidatus Limnocylindrales bacterium]
MSATKTCLFCGRVLPPKRIKNGKSDEHIIPQWLMDHLGLRTMPVTGMRWDVPSRQVLELKQHAIRKFVSGGVCAGCNGGWMSKLETETKPLLIRLIADPHELSLLTEYERFLLARWTLKTAAALNAASFGNPGNPLDRPIPRAHLKPLVSGSFPDEVVVFAGGCPNNRIADFIQNASWAVPKYSVPLVKEEQDRSYKVGMSFRSLLLGVAYYPNREYVYGLPERTHLVVWCNRRGVVRPFDDIGEVPIVANCPVVEGFLANAFIVSKARWSLTENYGNSGLIIRP